MNIMEAIERLRITAHSLPDDDPDKLEMLNIEGDYSKLMDWALKKRNEAAVTADSCAALIDTYRARKASFEMKSAKLKDFIQSIMDAAGERKYQGAAGTASIRFVAASPVIVNEDSIPERFFKTERKILKADINKAIKDGEEIQGVAMGNGYETLTIRK